MFWGIIVHYHTESFMVTKVSPGTLCVQFIFKSPILWGIVILYFVNQNQGLLSLSICIVSCAVISNFLLLQVACSCGSSDENATNHAEVVKLLIQSGSDVNAADRNSQTPLHLASYDGLWISFSWLSSMITAHCLLEICPCFSYS